MPETKTFPTPVVLTIVTGRLLCDIREVYGILNWMTGEDLMTHQLPRVCREATPVILALHPTLSESVDDEASCTTENFASWRAKWVARYGATLAVPKLTIDQHERIDPLSEAAEHFHPDNMIRVKT